MQVQTAIADLSGQILRQLCQVFAGREQTARWILAAILAKGHILLEDIPGVGKTTLAVAFSKVLGLTFGRVQFTPDVMPSDVVGYSVPTQKGKLQYRPGAVMCDLFLADELNRATPRTQSALLEAMEERQVTVDGVSHRLPGCFVVIATQNPFGGAGTHPLPDSQADRFMLRASLNYPDIDQETKMILRRQGEDPLIRIQPVLMPQQLEKMQEEVSATYLSEAVAQYAVHLVDATRKNEGILRGGSPRSTLSTVALAKGWAQLEGRDYVIPEDIRLAFLQAMPHRLILQGDGSACLQEIVQRVKPPKIK